MNLIKVLKLVGMNILVLIGILMLLNLVLISITEIKVGYKKITHKEVHFKDPRADLLIYQNIPWAKQHFSEFNALPTEYRSYIGWRRLAYRGETININEQGLRNTVQSTAVSDSSIQIAFLGGSAMWGTGANDSTTIPSLLAQQSNGKYHCLNLAESGYNAFQNYLFLQTQFIKGMRPSIVVSYEGVNNTLVDRPLYAHKREIQIRDKMKGADRDPMEETLTFKQFFIGPLKAFITQMKAQQTSSPIPKAPTEVQNKENARELLESWLATKHLAEQYGASFVAILQPNAYVGKPNASHLNLSQDPFQNGYGYYADVLELLKDPTYKELSNMVLDFTTAFDTDQQVYIDFCHVSPNGNRIIAEKILTHLQHHLTKN